MARRSTQDRLCRGVPAVIDRRLETKNFCHNVVDIHVLERLDHFFFFESWPMRDEEGPHGFELVVVRKRPTGKQSVDSTNNHLLTRTALD